MSALSSQYNVSGLNQAYDMLRDRDDKILYLERERTKDAEDIDELSQKVDEKDKEIKFLKEAGQRERKLKSVEDKHLEARLKYHDDLEKVEKERDKAQAMLQSQAEVLFDAERRVLEAREECVKIHTDGVDALKHDRKLSKRVEALQTENSLLARQRDSLQALLNAHARTATADDDAMHQVISDLMDENKQLSKQNKHRKHGKHRPHLERLRSPVCDSLAAELEPIAEFLDSNEQER